MKRKRGMALIVAMMSLTGAVIIGLSVVSVSSRSTMQASRVRSQATAFNLAEAGVERTVRWFMDQAYPPSTSANFDPFSGTKTLGGGTYTVVVDPDNANASNPLKSWLVTATGTANGISQKVQVTIKQRSFGQYAYFSDQESANPSTSPIWFMSRDRIRGPVHTNNSNGAITNIDWSGVTQPIFESTVTMAGASANYSPSAPTTDANYDSIFKLGRSALKLDEDRIELPTSSSQQQDAAWGATSGFPSSTGVSIPTSGGIYVKGDASITLSVNGSSKQVFTIKQGSTTSTVTVDLSAMTTTLKVGSTTTTRANVGTGVVFVDGDVTSLSGTVLDNVTTGSTTVRSAYTIAASIDNGKKIVITDDIKYKTGVDPTKGANDSANKSAGTLGLYASNIEIDKDAPKSLQIDALVMAGNNSTTNGSFYVENYASKDEGKLTLTGGLIQKIRGPVGTFSGTKIVSGYEKDYYYDPRLADDPPPYFPTTGKFDKLYWNRLPGG